MHRKGIEIEGVRQAEYSFKTAREMYDFMGWDTSDVDPKYLDYESDSGNMASVTVEERKDAPVYRGLGVFTQDVASITFSGSNSGPAPPFVTVEKPERRVDVYKQLFGGKE